MIRAVDHKPLELSDDEFEYYLLIIKAFGTNVFQETFETVEDEHSPQHGWITIVKPPLNAQLPMGVIFFLFNVMLNQRVRKFDDMMVKLEVKNGSG
jgi:hypothetical protein